MNKNLIRTIIFAAALSVPVYFGFHSCSCRSQEAGAENKARSGYSDEELSQMFDYVADKMEKHPEITDYLGPNAKHYMKKKAVRESTQTILDNVYNGLKEGYHLVNGE